MQFDNVNVTALDAIIEMLFGKHMVENFHNAYQVVDGVMANAFYQGQQNGFDTAEAYYETAEPDVDAAHMRGFENGYRAAERDYELTAVVDEDTVAEFSDRLGDDDFVAAPADEEDFWDRY